VDESPTPEEPADRAGAGLRGLVARHPVIAATLLACTAAGAALGAALLTGEWSLARRLLAGAVAGGGVGLLITATKMLG
jgi:hypothetical protein